MRCAQRARGCLGGRVDVGGVIAASAAAFGGTRACFCPRPLRCHVLPVQSHHQHVLALPTPPRSTPPQPHPLDRRPHCPQAPLGAAHFRDLVEAGYYTDLRFFRVIKGFMAQFGMHGDPEASARVLLGLLPGMLVLVAGDWCWCSDAGVSWMHVRCCDCEPLSILLLSNRSTASLATTRSRTILSCRATCASVARRPSPARAPCLLSMSNSMKSPSTAVSRATHHRTPANTRSRFPLVPATVLLARCMHGCSRFDWSAALAQSPRLTAGRPACPPVRLHGCLCCTSSPQARLPHVRHVWQGLTHDAAVPQLWQEQLPGQGTRLLSAFVCVCTHTDTGTHTQTAHTPHTPHHTTHDLRGTLSERLLALRRGPRRRHERGGSHLQRIRRGRAYVEVGVVCMCVCDVHCLCVFVCVLVGLYCCACVCVHAFCVHAFVRACMRACMRACVRACVRTCVSACVRACAECVCVCTHCCLRSSFLTLSS
jgi:hypothetical protein